MKKSAIVIIAFIAMITTVEAQRANIPVTGMISATYGKVTDTLTSTAAHYMVMPAAQTLPATMKITAVATCTEITLVTAGTLTIEGSLDGTNWHALRLPGTTTALETFTVTDVASQSFAWNLDFYPERYFRIKAVGNSSGQWTIAAKYVGIIRQ